MKNILFPLTGDFWWRTIIHKVTKSTDYLVTSGHLTNKKGYIFISTNHAITKFERIVAYENNPQTIKSHVVSIMLAREIFWQMKTLFSLSQDLWRLNLKKWWLMRGSPSTIVTWLHYVSIFRKLIATEPDRVMIYHNGSPCDKVTWLFD